MHIDVVWTDAKQSALIKSLLQNYPVPPVYFSVRHDQATGRIIRVCLDGKQRLTSIQKFIDGYVGPLSKCHLFTLLL